MISPTPCVFWLGLTFVRKPEKRRGHIRRYVVKQKKVKDSNKRFERVLKKQLKEKYILRLYVTGMTPQSTQAIQNIKRICDEKLYGLYNLEVIDIYQRPLLAQGEQIIATPTLIKKLPLPLRRFIGDMSDKERIVLGLDLRPKK